MSLRYGDKTRVGIAASKAGRNDPTPAVNVYEQEFLAPGTWTWPGSITAVDVLVVGGGGGGQTGRLIPTAADGGSGGGGAVVFLSTPVSGPVPVTVGAGGAAGGPTALSPGSAGGASYFGPSSAPIPTTTIIGYGGDGGGNATPNILDKGGADGNTTSGAGRYSSVLYPAGLQGSAGSGNTTSVYFGDSKWGYGSGALPVPSTVQYGGAGGGGRTSNAKANTGRGGCGGGFPTTSYAGGSGIVIVRWYQ